MFAFLEFRHKSPKFSLIPLFIFAYLSSCLQQVRLFFTLIHRCTVAFYLFPNIYISKRAVTVTLTLHPTKFSPSTHISYQGFEEKAFSRCCVAKRGSVTSPIDTDPLRQERRGPCCRGRTSDKRNDVGEW